MANKEELFTHPFVGIIEKYALKFCAERGITARIDEHMNIQTDQPIDMMDLTTYAYTCAWEEYSNAS